jgi:hypothetical protein
MRPITLSFLFCLLPAAIAANTIHVPHDYALLQSAVDASAARDTIVCDSVKDPDSIRIMGKTNLVVQGVLPVGSTRITTVMFIKNSSCALENLSFAGAKGYDGSNNNSCKSAPGLDGRPGADAIVLDSSTVAVTGCTARGGDGGSYGISYQSGMLCLCGSKGIPGTALKAHHSTVYLENDSLLSGTCAGTSIAGCFTNTCTVQGFGCTGLEGTEIDTSRSIISSISLDSSSTAGPAATPVNGRYTPHFAPLRHRVLVSASGFLAIPDDIRAPYSVSVFNARGSLVWYRNRVASRQCNFANQLGRGIYMVCVQSAHVKISGRWVNSR